jgi:hypothetical protein
MVTNACLDWSPVVRGRRREHLTPDVDLQKQVEQVKRGAREKALDGTPRAARQKRRMRQNGAEGGVPE